MEIAPPKTVDHLREFVRSLKNTPLKAIRAAFFATTFLLVFGTVSVLIGKPVFLMLRWLWSIYL